MANYGLPDLDFVLYRGYDVTGITLGLSDEIVNAIEDRTAAGDNVATSDFVGTQSGTVDMSGFYDSVVTVALESEPAVGVQNVLMYAMEGNVAGRHCECLANAVKTHYQRAMEKAGLHKGSAAWGANDQTFTIDRALLIAILAARGAAGNTQAAYVDAGAQTTNGGRWYVNLTALTLGGYTNTIIKLQHSTDHITFPDMAGATATFTAVGAQMVAFSGTVYRYLACAWLYSGAGSNPSATFAAALTKLP